MAFARRGGGAHALPKDIRLVSLIWMTSRGLGGECERGRRRLPSPWVSLCSGSAEGVAQCPHSTSGHTSGGRPAALPSAVRFPRQARAVRLSEWLLNENPDGSSGRSFSVSLSVGNVFFLRIKKYTSTFPNLETINKKMHENGEEQSVWQKHGSHGKRGSRGVWGRCGGSRLPPWLHGQGSGPSFSRMMCIKQLSRDCPDGSVR